MTQPASAEQSSWAEKPVKPLGRFEQLANIADRRANPAEGIEPKWSDPNEQLGMMHNFVDGVLAAADRGELASSQGVPYSREQIQRSFDDLSEALNSSNDEGKAQRVADALMGFPRAEGVRSGVRTLMHGENTSGVLADYLTDSMTARKMEQAKNPRRSSEAIRKVGDSTARAAGLESPALITGVPNAIMQPKPSIAEMMGDTPRTEQEPMSIDEQIDAMTSGLPEDQVDALFRYARNKALKREAQDSGDNQASILAEQQKGQAYRTMSPDTKAIADRLAGLYARKWSE